jgi:hypothetical protein
MYVQPAHKKHLVLSAMFSFLIHFMSFLSCSRVDFLDLNSLKLFIAEYRTLMLIFTVIFIYCGMEFFLIKSL